MTLQRIGSQCKHDSSGSLCGECDRSKTRLGASACLFNATLDGACLFFVIWVPVRPMQHMFFVGVMIT